MALGGNIYHGAGPALSYMKRGGHEGCPYNQDLVKIIQKLFRWSKNCRDNQEIHWIFLLNLRRCVVKMFRIYYLQASVILSSCWREVWSFKQLRWPTNIFAQCVSSHFQTPPEWPDICCLILERNRTSVYNATNHLAKLLYWRGTFLFTVEKNWTNVLNVTNHLPKLITWRTTKSLTVERSHINVANAINHLAKPLIWRTTCSLTVVKGCTNVLTAKNHLVRLAIF